MAKESKKALVPKLRFPEFRGAGGWVQVKLIDTADHSVKWSFVGGPFGSNLTSSDYADDGVRIIQLQNIGDGEFVNSYRIFTTQEKAEDLLSCNISPGDIILSKMGDPVGRACIVPATHERYVMCSDGIRLVVNEYDYNKYFVYSTINAPTFRSLVDKTATGSTRKRIGLDELRNLPLLAPKKAEQKKIADCLSSLDELIAAQGQKVEALKTYKRGLVQQLFPREGETLPRLRFPEFRDAPEWIEAPLGDLFDTSSGGTPDRTKREYWNGDIPWVTTSLVDFNVITKAEEFISEAGLDNSSAKVFPKGTVLIAMYGQGITRGKVAVLGIPAATNQACAAILPNDEVDNGFTFVSLCGRYEEMRKLSNSGGQENLSQTLIRALPFRYPKDVEEQTRVVECFSEIDTLIVGEGGKLDALKLHKEGLMQQLFPSVEDTK